MKVFFHPAQVGTSKKDKEFELLNSRAPPQKDLLFTQVPSEDQGGFPELRLPLYLDFLNSLFKNNKKMLNF